MLDSLVLVVDDNPETLDLFALCLENEGLRVRKAKTVLKALEILHDGSPRPSLIITDLMMPQTTGWDFLKHLRDDATLQAIPVVVITGAEAGESGRLADVVLQKPVDPLSVTDTVRRLLASAPQAH
jgi:CheY-like chemotaxis protein